MTLPTSVFAESTYSVNGTWVGFVGPGTGTVNVFGSNHKISTNSIVKGTFEGDTTHGSWIGTINTNYTVPDMSTSGHVTDTLTGTYSMSISNGAVTGTVTIPLTGQFSGRLKLTFQGQESQVDGLTGTWAGVLTVTQVTYVGMPLSSNITAPGSGQFTGTTQSSVPEFSGVAVVAFSALMVSLYLLKRKHK